VRLPSGLPFYAFSVPRSKHPRPSDARSAAFLVVCAFMRTHLLRSDNPLLSVVVNGMKGLSALFQFAPPGSDNYWIKADPPQVRETARSGNITQHVTKS
jgi:hypothetical protein